jgi:cell division protein FtsI/penicillin-binding protein 2
MKPKTVIGIFLVLLAMALTQAFAATTTKKKITPSTAKKSTAKSSKSTVTRSASSTSSRYRSSLVKSAAYRRTTFVRGVDALGPYNGTVAVVDPYTGRVLTLVNQKLALKSGFQPCSTIKVVAALAALSEGIIDRNTVMRWGRKKLDLTTALAKSDNPYFASLGEKLGFDRVSYYARLFGLGERAGLGIEGEQPGILPEKIPDAGLGMMTSFGSGISLTPLELAAMLSAIANGGTLYYLQHPRTPEEVATYIPRVKRHLALDPGSPPRNEWRCRVRHGPPRRPQ